MQKPASTSNRFGRASSAVSALCFACLILLLLVGAQSGAAASVWESVKENVSLEIPDEPGAWVWLRPDAQWTKARIIKGARRELVTLKSTGKAADGQGALLYLSMFEAEPDMTLQKAAEDSRYRSFFLGRFKGTEGEVESEEIKIGSETDDEGHPALILRTKGRAANLKHRQGDCTAYLLITVARGKLYLLTLFAFPSEGDREGLVNDLDFLEGSGLMLLNTKPLPQKPPPPVKDETNGGKTSEPEPAREDQVIENRAQGWRLVLDKKLDRLEISPKERRASLELKCGGSDPRGGYQFQIYATPQSQTVGGKATPAPELIRWIGPSWWKVFTKAHTKGELATFKWPSKPRTEGVKTFLTLPNVGDDEARVVVFEAADERPATQTATDMRKHDFFDKVKNARIGKRGKASAAVRGVMQGVRPGFPGRSTVIRYGFISGTHSYRVFVTYWGAAHLKWGEALSRTLESWKFGVKFKD